MRSNLIGILGVGMLVAVVFAVTLISQYTGGTAGDGDATQKQAEVIGVPLLFATNEMRYEPGSEDLDKKYFPGFFEVSDNFLKVNFWFKNPHGVPVRFTVRGRSCSACTTANIAVIDPELMARFQRMTAAARLGTGAVPVPDLISPMAHLALLNSLAWQNLDFERPDAGVTVPPAPGGETPTWGVFQMVIHVTGVGAKTLSAEVGMSAGDSPTVRQAFSVATVGAPVLDVTPKSIDLGEFDEGSPPREVQLYAWSATRDQSDLIPPAVNVAGNDPFVRTGTPVPMTAAERAGLVASLPAASGIPPRVLGGFRVPVTVYRRLPAELAKPGDPSQPDVGPFERQIGLVSPGSPSLSVNVTANVTGVVGLRDGGVIDLKDFNGRSGESRTVTLVSDRSDLKLELLPDGSKPSYLKFMLGEPRSSGGRKYWELTVTVPPKACLGDLPPDSTVMLSGATGGETIRVKLPVKGRGFVRGR